MSWRAAVVTFPGSNCDRDMAVALEAVSGVAPLRAWHADAELPERLDFIALPGGFSYGDYLRCGAMAARAPIMPAIRAFADRGGHVLGVCNGFQILTEAGLLPGKAPNTPFDGRALEGRVVGTWKAGQRVFG